MATTGAVLGVIRAARPSLKDAHQRVAFALNAAFLAAGYTLTGVGSQAAASGTAAQDEEEVGIEGWDDMDEAYTFRYSGGGQPDLAKSAVVRCVSMGDLLMVEAARLPDSESGEVTQPHNLEIKVAEYAADTDGGNYQQQYKNLDGLVSAVNSQILSQISEAAKKPGISSALGTQAEPVRDARRPPPEPESEDRPQPGPGPGIVMPPIPTYGGSDLLPGPGAGVFPRRGPGGLDGGMLLGPTDPRWRQRVGLDSDQGFLGEALPGVLPGARFDPFGPPGVPGFEPDRFTRDQRRPPGRGPHPDVEHFHPF